MGVSGTPPAENRRLQKLHQLRILDTDAERAYDDLVLLASVICDTPIALVSLVDEQRQWFKARLGLAAPETPRSISFCTHAILQDDLFVVEDTQEDERFRDNPLVSGDPHIRFYAGIPLALEPGLNLGTLCVIDRKPRSLNSSQLAALAALGAQIVDQFRLRQQLIERQALDEAKDEFLARVSHELRTPLTSIISALGLAQQGGEVGSEQLGQLLEIANSNAGHLLSTVNEILELSKLDAGRVALDFEPLVIADLAKEAIQRMTAEFDQHHCAVKFSCDGEPGASRVIGDRMLLRQLMTHLLSNAAQRSPHGGGVTVAVEVGDAEVTFSVLDEGPGLTPEQQDGLFIKFPAMDASTDARVPGLGLVLCRKIAEVHGGTIGVESAPGDGARIYLRLDRAPAEDQ